MRPLVRSAVVVAAVLASLASGVSPASAHAEIREADPAVNGTAPVGQDEVTITFISLDAEVPVEVDVLDPDGDSIVTGRPTIVEQAATGTTVAVPVEPLVAGRHQVRWEAMSSDGDGLSTGSYEFVAEERSSGGPGVWLLWIVALAIPAAILLRPKHRRRGPGEI